MSSSSTVQDAPSEGMAPEPEITSLMHPRMRPWLIWLVVFYGAWAFLNFVIGLWPHTAQHWPIALAMALGSYVAGSTPMGGGTVGFPVLVLLFDLPASLGRNFGLVIQSIGMTSASIFILCRRSPIDIRVLSYSIVGAAVGIPLGTFLIVPHVPDAAVKLIFACLWASFGVLTLIKNQELCALSELPLIPMQAARRSGLIVGVTGGITTSLTGVGVDMILYTVLVLLFRMDLKAAVPTSVIVMAVSSVMGALLHLAIGDLNQELFHHWLAAAPVVIVGAPFGAFLVSVISRVKTLYFVAMLCVLQFAWALYQVRPTSGQWILVAVNLAVSTVGFVVLYRVGKQRTTERGSLPQK